MEMRRTISEGFALLSDWAGRILSQAAWKYAHPSSKCPEDVLQYEKTVRYNYNDDEKVA